MFKQNFVIVFGIRLSFDVLPALVGILSVPNRLHVREGFRSLAVIKAAVPVDEGAQFVRALGFRRVIRVREFGRADCAAAARLERSRLRLHLRRATQSFIEEAWLFVGVANRCARELLKLFLRAAARVRNN